MSKAHTILSGLLASCVAVALIPASAQARQVRLFSGLFGSASTLPADPYPLSDPGGVAVDQADGDVYVADTGNNRVEKFNASGEFLLAFGAGVGGPGVDVCGGLVMCSPGATGSAADDLNGARFLAVDNSPGPSKGDVYVAVGGRVSKFDESGNLIESWGEKGQLEGSSLASPPAPFTGSFGPIGGIAVDPSSNLWVYGQGPEDEGGIIFTHGRMFEFNQEGGSVTDWSSHLLVATESDIAVDAEDNVYIDEAGTTLEFDGSGSIVGDVTEPSEGVSASALAVNDSTGDLYVHAERASAVGNSIVRYSSACRPMSGHGPCSPLESFGLGHLAGNGLIAVDPSSSSVYVVEPESGEVAAFGIETVPDVLTVKPASLTGESAVLNGTVNPDGVPLKEGLEGCRFEWGETEAYGHEVACDKSAAEIGTGSAPVEVDANISGGLHVGSTYHYRLVAGNANDVNAHLDEPSEGQDLAFGPPRIDSVSVVGVTATGATLQAKIDPVGADTHVHFEYGTQAGVYTDSTPAVDVGSGASDVSVTPSVVGLTPHSVYHYRVVAESVLAEGPVLSLDQTFTMQTAVSGLPDGREWEMVSPADMHGGLIYPLQGAGMVQAAATGNAITYVTDAPTEGTPPGYANGVQVLSTRGAHGWKSRDVSLPHISSPGLSTEGEEYRFFSEDLARAIVQPTGQFIPSSSPLALAPGVASEQTAFLRDLETGAYTPLVTGCPEAGEPCEPGVAEHADVEAGTIFGYGSGGSSETFCQEDFCGPQFEGATPEAKQVIVGSLAPLTEPGAGSALYEFSEGRLTPVSVLPASEGGGIVSGELGGAVESLGSNARHAISRDGSRVVWSHEHAHYLFVRENATQSQSQVNGEGECTEPAKACTIRLDEGLAGGQEALYQAASENTKIVFFTEHGEHFDDLYEYNLETGKRTLVAKEAVGELPVLGVSADGSTLYLVSSEVLDNGTAPVAGAVAGQPNLYVRHEGTLGLVAVLSPEDVGDFVGGGGGGLSGLTAQVSASGEWLAFMSDRSLTGYDNEDLSSGTPGERMDEEVFLYRASLPAGGVGVGRAGLRVV